MKTELERLKEKVAELEKQQLVCNHEWEEPKYEPEEQDEVRYETEWHGVDCCYKAVRVGSKTVPRWSRVCKKCGKREYTYTMETVSVKTITRPKF